MSERISINLTGERIVCMNAWYPSIIDFSNVLILKAGNREGASPKIKISYDRGLNWQMYEDNNMHFGDFRQLRDGSVFGFVQGNNIIDDKIRREQSYKPFITWSRRAKSVDDLINGRYSDDFPRISIPCLDGTVGDADDYFTGCISSNIVELSDGDLAIAMYGCFKNDKIQIPYYKNAYQYRSWVCISQDRGNTWNYFSTIASNEECRLPELSEGYSEADIINPEGDKLISVMRSGGNPVKGGSVERYTPLFLCRSENRGVTWSKPEVLYKYGVWPRLLRMESGVIACVSGRPGVFLLLSNDGINWTSPEVITDYDDDYGKCSSGYCSIIESSPGCLAVYYDEFVSVGTEQINVVKVRNYEIKI